MISKKDLLKEMNISYGQLYRWKREGLIPDEWFIKQSVSSGQETYFVRDKIIPRIKKILELKDKYQLEQLKNFFCPDLKSRTFSTREVLIIEDIDPIIARLFLKGKESLSIYELVVVYILSKNQDILKAEGYVCYDYSKVTITNSFYIIELNGYYMLIGDDNLIIDKRIKIHKKIKIEDIAKMIASKLS